MNMWQNLNKDENGFLHIELLILMAILSSVAMTQYRKRAWHRRQCRLI